MLKLPVYLDNHATTPVDPRVMEVMLPYFTETFGNAASRSHSFGWAAEEAVEFARENIALTIGAETKEIIFTSGATESNNLALQGVAEAYAYKGKHIITAATEHPSVFDTCKALERKGWSVTYLPANAEGLIDTQQLMNAMTEYTVLVSIMHANNEIGTIQQIGEIGEICRERGVLFHTDATQSLGKIYFNVESQNVDLASFNAHKIYGPKGIGALYVRRRAPHARLTEQIHGGGHERGLRSGTLNVPAIVGFGKAVQIALESMIDEARNTQRLRDMLWNGLASMTDVLVNGPDPVMHAGQRLPGNLNVSFIGVNADALMMDVKDVAVSAGSACASAQAEPSHVLMALHIGEQRTRSAIRFGLGRFTTEEEIDYTIDRYAAAVKRLRTVSPAAVV
ncbi:MAG TPA: IscS subfamily cysteine desulfurase [Candidatus Kapabacteria bacterium]|nr:IscS subfamily cysteine desulfurase [Candidatus Kapabacteria bacterium]